jgi:single-strand DNA-binding protein
MQDFPVFVDVDAWDRLAELCGQHLTKGSPVLVEGRLQMDTWERDGVKHQKIKVRATLIKFLSRGDRPNGGYSRGVDQSGYGASDDYGDSPF